MIDLDAYNDWRRAHPTRPLPRDMEEALVAEVERLRALVAFLCACVPPTNPSDYGYEVWEERLRDEVKRERDAVVAWLRDEYDTDSARNAADEIEDGEHRREEAAP